MLGFIYELIIDHFYYPFLLTVVLQYAYDKYHDCVSCWNFLHGDSCAVCDIDIDSEDLEH